MKALHYCIKLKDPGAHRILMTVEMVNPNQAGQIVSLARWVPGSYLIRELAKHMVQIQAFANEQPIELTKLNNNRWRCAPVQAERIRLEYEIYAWDYSVRGAHFDGTHAFIDGARVFLNIDGFEDVPCTVQIEKPVGVAYQAWRIATSMQVGVSEDTFTANNYLDLIDHPFEVGVFEERMFTVNNIPHRLMVTGRHYGCLDRFVNELTKVCAYYHQLLPTPTDLNHYTFLLSLSAQGYGGLEHKNSTACHASRYDMPQAETPLTKEQIAVLSLLSHEYFHLWNVKRLKPAAFMPYSLSDKLLTRQLWAFEGITAYYDHLSLFRAKIITQKQYLEWMEHTITRLSRSSGPLKQSVTDASFDAWIKFYQPDENTQNASVSYYIKGSLIALCIDLKIQQLTNQKCSLDDVMRLLWTEYGITGIGVPEGGIEKAVIQVAGLAIKPCLYEWLYEAKPLPLQALLASEGIDLQWRGAYQSKDLGGELSVEKTAEWAAAGILGFGFETKDHHAVITAIDSDQEAESMGLAVGDRLVAIDGLQFTEHRYEKLQKLIGLHHKIKIHVFRDDQLLCFEGQFRAPPVNTAVLTVDSTNEKGSTLIEVLISMALLFSVMAIGVEAFLQIQHHHLVLMDQLYARA